MDVLTFAKKKDDNQMDRINTLYNELIANSMQLDALVENILKLEKEQESFEALESLYQNEFLLFMKNVSIYDDLLLEINRADKTIENEFILAKIKKDAETYLRVEIMEL